ncbi:serine/threonine-protein kinase [Ruminococcus albus]|uniref:non-specific serine/threonine protein kinase n=1 Tax=Ruminococcus albus TaxID=1264 RepID=A0A1H7LTT2_RUMAL|nr:serine/threonine-protein kinase [Ruminococcus albus]SEL02356.1 serine/threonine protein kinase [Ruminococcus albus]
MTSSNLVLRDRYEIIAELGRGGMSTVYLAKDKILGSYWAVKKISNSDVNYLKGFKKEVELLSSLNHADIPRIVDRIEYGGNYFVVMDFVDGVSLGKKVLAEGPQQEKDVVEWAKMLCDVLEYLHTVKDNPIIYCDLKPDNIMYTKSGRIKLIDFGIAKECIRGKKYVGEAVGTKGYAAPEQYKDASNIFDERTDIYSFGASLSYVLTGSVPLKPPYGVKSVRERRPVLSEGIDYIIRKCTKDNPDDRYRNFSEVRADLNDINELTGVYRRKMRNRLVGFYASIVACLLFMIPTYIGYTQVQAEKADNYQHYYQLAASDVQNKNYESAAKNYLESIKYKPQLTETYLLYFTSMLPRENDENYITLTKNAIDIMRNSYIDNKNSPMFHNKEITYQVMKKCVEVNDSSYAGYALKYIDQLKTENYKSDELEYFEVLAMNCSKDLSTQDFDEIGDVLDKLEKYTDTSILTVDDKLQNYYTIMNLYNEYPIYLSDPYNKIYETGVKAKAIIDGNLESGDMSFSSIIPMYELTASALYNGALLEKDDSKKEETYRQTIEWYGYLHELNDNLSEVLWLKKASSYRKLYDLTNENSFLESSVKELEELTRKYNNCFSAQVNLAMSYLDSEMIKNENERDLRKALECYDKVNEMKERNSNLSAAELSQFGTLKQAFINAGIMEK